MLNFDFQLTWSFIIQWLSIHSANIIAIVFGGIIIYRIFKRFVNRLIERVVRKNYTDLARDGMKRRSQTLSGFLSVTGKTLIILVVILMIFLEIGVNIRGFLTGIGILGLAIAFGVQGLIKDVIAGFFILIEDQYRVGDWVNIDKTEGKVEKVNLRRTVLRGVNGDQYFVIHSTIKKVSNLTKGLSRINVTIFLSYEANIDKAQELINKVGKELLKDPKMKPLIIKEPEVLGVDSIKDGKVSLKIFGETQPGKQWEVASVFRKRIKTVLTDNGVELK